MSEEISRDYVHGVYTELLAREGFRPKTDEDGDIQFRNQGFTTYIRISEDDLPFLQMFIPSVYTLESGEEDTVALAVMAELNRQFKLVKVCRLDHSVAVLVEMLLAQPEDLGGSLLRIADVLVVVAHEFHRLMSAALRERQRQAESELDEDDLPMPTRTVN
ncbi:T3SS (YopN, CesT) and YbjN peptide-binding chaperone 1 [Plasticicumulans sp.]|uniref:T3SS (YopN, CesT) and YbjN peptide-binding chaperone 1 n=1 Tax=Plasticicumulans sp. TaxID=2307179 RepID=UPI000F908625|nr:hypothetical protein [Plasticicumulans sp.]MBS0599780.1 hypothetical protein [Pseudomonadota bacterium]RTL06089.1 MAG: hypothetical protein EKK65_00480 [Xanthomonadales bacterium]HMV39588.1 hypothetical protein [Plasticicumulans sp.]HMW29562.1 hypothetical protein [Plasticicumulans sp.]HMW44143.1 hypothetical protein [Plasticicumulans sp.]